jgi:ribonuclease VapC
VIAVDTSALMAIVLDDPEAEPCIAALEKEDGILISAGTVAEALIVAARRNVRSEIERLINEVGLEVVALTPAAARAVADAYEKWGKGVHRAALNFGDCFAYSLAKERRCRLLYVGGDFARTDIVAVL